MAIPSEAKSSSNCTKVLVDTFVSVRAMSDVRRRTTKASGEQALGNTMVQSNRQRQSVEMTTQMRRAVARPHPLARSVDSAAMTTFVIA
jgi:hypothetical protein